MRLEDVHLSHWYEILVGDHKTVGVCVSISRNNTAEFEPPMAFESVPVRAENILRQLSEPEVADLMRQLDGYQANECMSEEHRAWRDMLRTGLQHLPDGAGVQDMIFCPWCASRCTRLW